MTEKNPKGTFGLKNLFPIKKYQKNSLVTVWGNDTLETTYETRFFS